MASMVGAAVARIVAPSVGDMVSTAEGAAVGSNVGSGVVGASVATTNVGFDVGDRVVGASVFVVSISTEGAFVEEEEDSGTPEGIRAGVGEMEGAIFLRHKPHVTGHQR